VTEHQWTVISHLVIYGPAFLALVAVGLALLVCIRTMERDKRSSGRRS
jgi:hypothetical protein